MRRRLRASPRRRGAAALSMAEAGGERQAPVAVRTVDLDSAADLDLTRDGEPYRGALLIGLRDGVPVGTASTALAGGPRLAAATIAALFAEAPAGRGARTATAGAAADGQRRRHDLRAGAIDRRGRGVRARLRSGAARGDRRREPASSLARAGDAPRALRRRAARALRRGAPRRALVRPQRRAVGRRGRRRRVHRRRRASSTAAGSAGSPARSRRARCGVRHRPDHSRRSEHAHAGADGAVRGLRQGLRASRFIA